ncbi:polyprenol phosphomannose-dependent alpha 1,6 mannosyltransferase MptB [Pseudonocardia spinosispora]|uniref:polyprenol phosphomannose-dependent alpha 1,6 mannosyltransferase MptB n=1 Tax=Pseudonocardia spinosispora TaxID=103441 RepID=UPI0012EC66F1|nr:polyprenol phosphomannose-dependent alpha 1,6 mannosyltransferase MptB [Pseudonocardia spinosispora]
MTSQPQLSSAPVEPLAPEAMGTPVVRYGWWQRWSGSPGRAPLLLGLLGSATVAVGGVGAAGVLRHDPVLSGTIFSAWRFGHGYNLAVMATYLGLALSVWAWVLLGRDVLARRAGGRAVLSTSLVWLAPIVVAPPLFTRDPYSYLANGAVALKGLDPYVAVPNVLTGPIADNVHWFWNATPAQYGPLFVGLAKAVVAVTGENMIAGVIAMRLLMLVGLALFIAAVPGLCRHLGGRPAMALWVAVANPVMVFVLVGGPHNDLLVVGFLALGSLMVLNRRHAVGIALVTAAAAVKITAVFLLPFLVLVWAARLQGSERARIIRAGLAGIAVFAAVMVACSVLTGLGFGWLTASSAPTTIINWMSLPTAVGQLLHTIVTWMFGPMMDTVFIAVPRILAIPVFGYCGVKLWLAARVGGVEAVRRGAWLLMLFVVCAPAVLPWYPAWGMALLAAVVWTERGLQLVVLVSCFLVACMFPSGEVALYAFGYLIIVMACAVVAARALRAPNRPG